MHSPMEVHQEALCKFLLYFKSTLRKGIFFKKNEKLNLAKYTNADGVRLVMDQCSTSGYYTLLGGKSITWRTKKKSMVAQ